MPRRLDPRSVPYRGLGLAVQWAVGVGTLALVAGSVIDLAGAAVLVPAAAAVAGVAAFGWTVAYHRRFAYELTAESLDITSGVVSRRTRKIPLGRIQNVDIRQGLVPRLLGVAEVRFETAGGSGTEATLRYVDRAVARDLQEEVDRHGGATSVEPVAAEASPLYAITPFELGLLSVTSVDWRAVGFVVLAAVGVLPGMMGSTPPVPALAPLAIAAQPVALTAVGLAGNAALLTARFYDFRLWRTRETLRYERGLVRRFSGSIPLDRVHLLRLRDNPATRRLGLAALDIRTAGYGPDTADTSAAAVPIAERARVLDLARSVEPFPELELERPPRRARLRYGVRYAVLVGLLTVALLAADRLWQPLPWEAAIGLLVVVPVAAHLTWTHRGYAIGERALLVRAGFWRRTTYVVPLYRVQTVGTTATVLQRRRRLATVRIDTASGAPAAHDLDAGTAAGLREAVTDGLFADRRRRRAERDGSSDPGEAEGITEPSGASDQEVEAGATEGSPDGQPRT